MWTRELLQPRVSRVLLAVTLGALSLGSALALTAVSAWLITRAWQMPPVLDLTVAVVTVRALGISRGVLGYCERLVSHDVALHAAGTAREEIVRRVAAASPETVLRHPSGDLVTRLGKGVDDVADVLVRAVVPFGVAAVLAVASIAAVVVISPGAAAVLAAAMAAAGVLAPTVSARAAAATEHVAVEHHSRRDAAALLALDHAPELRVGGRLDQVVETARAEQHRWGAAEDRAAAPAAVAAAAPTAATGIAVIAAVVAGIGLANSVAPTTLAILMVLPLAAFEATAALPGAAVALTRARIAARRLQALTDPDGSARTRPDLPGLTLHAGDRVAVVGPSGSGKTTLLMHTDGTFFAEDAHLFDTTVRDNLLVARGDASDAELVAALGRVGLDRWVAALPAGLATVLVGGVAAVSAGQRRRLLLARALVSGAATVLLDEPTEHLDVTDADRLLAELLTPGGMFGADTTVVVATHHLPPDTAVRTVRLTGRGNPRR